MTYVISSYLVPHVFFPRNQYIKQGAQIHKQGTKNFVELLSFHDQEAILDDIVQIRRQSAPGEAEKPELGPMERTMTVLKLTDGLGLAEGGVKVFENIDSNKQRAAATRQGTMGILAVYRNIMKEK